MLAEELREAAQLRAEAYYEVRPLRTAPHAATCRFFSWCPQLPNQATRYSWALLSTQVQNQSHGRFTQSFIKQFAEQEARSLEQRCAAGSGGGGRPECITLVAHATEHPGSSCVGTLDVRPPAAAPGGRWPEGVPAGDAAAAYALNVVVAEDWRGQGLGRALVAAAKQLAQQEWQAVQLYAHVDTMNEAALALYLKSGFESVAVEGGLNPESIIGQRQLLRCELR